MLIRNGKIVTFNPKFDILEDRVLVVRDGAIVDIVPNGTEIDLSEEVFDANGQYILPGNICAHTHFYGAYARGMNIPGAAPKNFIEILDKLWWPLDRSLSKEAVYYSAAVCLIDAIQHGTTTLFDHHASPSYITGSLDEIEKAAEEAGLRVSLCYEVTDRNGEQQAMEGIEENLRFIEKNSLSKETGMIASSFGLHACLTLSEETLKTVRKVLPENVGVHIHTAEDLVDQHDSLAKYGQRVIERLYRHDLLNEKSIAVHGVHLDANEISLLKRSGAALTHQPRSNMNNAVGIGDINSLLNFGILVCLGNDGFSNSMWEEWKAAYLVHKVWNRDPQRMGGFDVVKMAVDHNRQLVERHFNIHTGMIAPGYKADLIFVDYQPFTPVTSGNLPWHILFGFRESMVTSTMVNGRFLMRDRKVTILDAESVLKEALALAPKVWAAYEKQF